MASDPSTSEVKIKLTADTAGGKDAQRVIEDVGASAKKAAADAATAGSCHKVESVTHLQPSIFTAQPPPEQAASPTARGPCPCN